VDDTIHFISKLRLQLAKGHSLPIAVKRSFLSAGKAIIITSIILCGGFMTLSLSSFLGTFYIGVLISLTLLIAVLSDLFILPWLILKCLRWSPPSNRSWISKILRP
ncbi:MAG: MMPL family transporter, partial [Flavobacteriales bacterium]